MQNHLNHLKDRGVVLDRIIKADDLPLTFRVRIHDVHGRVLQIGLVRFYDALQTIDELLLVTRKQFVRVVVYERALQFLMAAGILCHFELR